MNKLTALIEAAKTSMNTTHPDEVAWYASDTLANKGVAYVEDSNFIALANPTTILELCALLEKAEAAAKAFKTAREQADQYGHLVEASLDIAEAYYQADRMNDEALATIKQWKDKA